MTEHEKFEAMTARQMQGVRRVIEEWRALQDARQREIEQLAAEQRLTRPPEPKL